MKKIVQIFGLAMCLNFLSVRAMDTEELKDLTVFSPLLYGVAYIQEIQRHLSLPDSLAFFEMLPVSKYKDREEVKILDFKRTYDLHDRLFSCDDNAIDKYKWGKLLYKKHKSFFCSLVLASTKLKNLFYWEQKYPNFSDQIKILVVQKNFAEPYWDIFWHMGFNIQRNEVTTIKYGDKIINKIVTISAPDFFPSKLLYDLNDSDDLIKFTFPRNNCHPRLEFNKKSLFFILNHWDRFDRVHKLSAIKAIIKNKELSLESLCYEYQLTDIAFLVNERSLFNDLILLAYAVTFKNESACKTLLEFGADPNLILSGSNTRALNDLPLHVAINQKNSTFATLLIEYGADVNAYSRVDGKTPLINCIYRVTSDNYIEIFEILTMLIQAGAQKNLGRDRKGSWDLIVKDYSQSTNKIHEDQRSELLKLLGFEDKKNKEDHFCIIC